MIFGKKCFMDFKNLPEDLTNLLSHSLMLPFWYVAIYIFHPELYSTNDYILITALTVCLTISSATITTSIIVLVSNGTEGLLDKKVVYPSIYFQIVFFSSILILSYIFKLVTGCTFEFYGFVLFYFIPKIFLVYIVNKPKKTYKQTYKIKKPSSEKTIRNTY